MHLYPPDMGQRLFCQLCDQGILLLLMGGDAKNESCSESPKHILVLKCKKSFWADTLVLVPTPSVANERSTG